MFCVNEFGAFVSNCNSKEWLNYAKFNIELRLSALGVKPGPAAAPVPVPVHSAEGKPADGSPVAMIFNETEFRQKIRTEEAFRFISDMAKMEAELKSLKERLAQAEKPPEPEIDQTAAEAPECLGSDPGSLPDLVQIGPDEAGSLDAEALAGETEPDGEGSEP